MATASPPVAPIGEALPTTFAGNRSAWMEAGALARWTLYLVW